MSEDMFSRILEEGGLYSIVILLLIGLAFALHHMIKYWTNSLSKNVQRHLNQFDEMLIESKESRKDINSRLDKQSCQIQSVEKVVSEVYITMELQKKQSQMDKLKAKLANKTLTEEELENLLNDTLEIESK